ncbi:6-carboxy-5,6,7,8-tetrahydropterin synthase [Bacillus coahuilensis m2-6]|uniref:6-carboxytetrahydropterin synthase QueD n=1 Tax=Bacillus coahuilensis TaxID=408580 RepID=UPI0001850C60|nr:6-carboxytetrahydropterin synthase QueD [Bacillus coahuilensis]KUP08149.1 6-carboxy-5,6,7,8-tetrahydropterin synthase [Bacillus coahuilensis m2-6]
MMQQIYPTTPHQYSYELNKDFHFSAAHYVPHEDAGVCQRIHGHTYFCNVTIAGDSLDDSGFLINFKDVKKLIHDRFDHTILNDDNRFHDEVSDRFPTTEVVAREIYLVIQEHLNSLKNKPTCIQVFLRETPTSYVVYRPRREMNEIE